MNPGLTVARARRAVAEKKSDRIFIAF